VDYSDREAFFANDDNDSNDNNNEDKDQPLLLPSILYDEQNAMVLCDTCDRPYHQRCHFIPIITLPRGDWHCLICKTSATGGDKQSVYPFPPKSSESGGEILLPNPDAIHAWEYDSRHYKALAWKRELSRFKGVLSNQLQHIRLAEDTLRAHTSTKRAQQHVSLSSQILLQTILKLAGAKLRIRQWFQSLDKVLKSNGEEEWDVLDEFLSEHPDQEIKWFPYGRDIERRIVPRLEQAGEEVPNEVVTHAKNMPEDHDDDDLISLDELKCCICFRGDATDENDLILCDGVGCFRA
jgi:ribosomal protein L37AE/L43A